MVSGKAANGKEVAELVKTKIQSMELSDVKKTMKVMTIKKRDLSLFYLII